MFNKLKQAASSAAEAATNAASPKAAASPKGKGDAAVEVIQYTPVNDEKKLLIAAAYGDKAAINSCDLSLKGHDDGVSAAAVAAANKHDECAKILQQKFPNAPGNTQDTWDWYDATHSSNPATVMLPKNKHQGAKVGAAIAVDLVTTGGMLTLGAMAAKAVMKGPMESRGVVWGKQKIEVPKGSSIAYVAHYITGKPVSKQEEEQKAAKQSSLWAMTGVGQPKKVIRLDEGKDFKNDAMENFVVHAKELEESIATLITTRSWKDWTSLEELKKDLDVILKCFASGNQSRVVLLSCTAASLWLFLNVMMCKQVKANNLWENFTKVIDQIGVEYVPAAAPSAQELKDMKAALADFFENSVKPIKPPGELAQAVPSDFKFDDTSDEDAKTVQMKELARKYASVAKDSFPSFQEKLQRLDPKGMWGIKSADRAFEKAEKDYQKDVRRVLDYLRGLVHVEVDLSDSGAKIGSRFEKVRESIMKGAPLRLKTFPETAENTLPRILMNFQYKELVSEVQVHFRYVGFDDEYQIFKHTIYELTRKEHYKVNEKDHVIELCLDLIRKTGVHLTDKSIKVGVTKLVTVRLDGETDASVIIEKNGGEQNVINLEIEQLKDADGDLINKFVFHQEGVAETNSHH